MILGWQEFERPIAIREFPDVQFYIFRAVRVLQEIICQFPSLLPAEGVAIWHSNVERFFVRPLQRWLMNVGVLCVHGPLTLSYLEILALSVPA